MVRTATGFTGEETVEITCHGGSGPVERILDALERFVHVMRREKSLPGRRLDARRMVATQLQ